MSDSGYVEKKVDESWKDQIEKERAKEAPAPPSRPATPQTPGGASAGAPPPTGGVVPGQEEAPEATAHAPEEAPMPEDMPAEDDPETILFEQFIQSLAIQASMFLGASPDPRTGLVSEDLGQAKYMIDIIGMLASKTRNNLNPREQQLMGLLLQDLRMAYVQRAQAAAQMPGQPGAGPGGMPGQPPL